MVRQFSAFFLKAQNLITDPAPLMEDGGSITLRVNITPSEFGLYTDTIYVTYTKKSPGESRILEGDKVALYGQLGGMTSYESILGASISIPKLDAMFIDLLS